MARPVRDCQDVIDNEAFDNWVLFYREYPLFNHHFSNMISQLTAVCWKAPGGKGRSKLKAQDFYPDYGKTMLSQQQKMEIAAQRIRRR